MAKSYKYKGYIIKKSNTTTTVYRNLPGSSNRYYQAIVHLYGIDGLKPAGRTPFIVSLQDAKKYINERM